MNLLVRCQRAFNATSIISRKSANELEWSTHEELKDTEGISILLVAKAWKALKASALGRWISYLCSGCKTRPPKKEVVERPMLPC